MRLTIVLVAVSFTVATTVAYVATAPPTYEAELAKRDAYCVMIEHYARDLVANLGDPVRGASARDELWDSYLLAESLDLCAGRTIDVDPLRACAAAGDTACAKRELANLHEPPEGEH